MLRVPARYLRCCEQINFVKRHAGHSKWANIKHIKGLKDAERSLVFARLTRLIKVAIQEGGSANPIANLKLQQAIDQAKRANMPVSNIQSVLKVNENNKTDAKKYLLEIRGPVGSLLLLEVFTDNFAKCKQTISTILRKANYSYADGGAKRSFDYKGVIDVEVGKGMFEKEEDVIETCTDHAIDAGAEDVQLLHFSSDRIEVRFLCDANNLSLVQKSLETKYKYPILSSSSEYVPINCVNMSLTDYSTYEKLCEKLDCISEVTNIYDNILPN